MNVSRVDFVGLSVLGPRQLNQSSYKPADWKGWTVQLEGPHLILEGEGRRIEVPRARCVVYFAKGEAKPVEAPKGKAK